MIKSESFGFGPFIGKCKPTADYIPVGACSDQNTEAKNKRIRKGEDPFKTHKSKGKIRIESSKNEKEKQKFDTNIQKAVLDIAGSLEKSFRKFSKNTRDKAWDRITSPDGEKEIKKIIQDPNRQLNTFQKLAFKEWILTQTN